MQAKLSFWNNGTFKSYVYWTGYKNVLYLDVEFARPTTDFFTEENEDDKGDRTTLFQRQRLSQSFELILMNPLVDVVSIVGLHDNVTLEFLETGETYNLKDRHVTFSDNGERADKLASVILTFDMQVVTTGCEQSEYSVTPC